MAVRYVFWISRRNPNNNIYNKCGWKLPQGSKKIHQIQGDISDGWFYPQGDLYECIGNLKEVDNAGEKLRPCICAVCHILWGQIFSLTADEGAALKLPRFIRWGYPVKRKAATFAAAFHSFIPQPASGCSSALPCLAAYKVLVKFLAVKHIYTVHFSEPLCHNVRSKKMPCGLSRMASLFTGLLPPLFLPCGLRDIFRAFQNTDRTRTRIYPKCRRILDSYESEYGGFFAFISKFFRGILCAWQNKEMKKLWA